VIAAVAVQIAEFVSGYLALPASGIPDYVLTSHIIGALGVLVAAAYSNGNVWLSSRTMLIAESSSIVTILFPRDHVGDASRVDHQL